MNNDFSVVKHSDVILHDKNELIIPAQAINLNIGVLLIPKKISHRFYFWGFFNGYIVKINNCDALNFKI